MRTGKLKTEYTMPKPPEQYHPSPEEIKKEMDIQKEISEEESEKLEVILKEGLQGDSIRKELEEKAEKRMEVRDGYIYKIEGEWYKYSIRHGQVAEYGVVGGPMSGMAGWIYKHKEIKSPRQGRMGAAEMERLSDEEEKIMFPRSRET